MRTVTCLLVSFAYIFGLIQCKNDSVEPIVEDPPTAEDYYPLDIGNYWIYEWIKVESDGSESPLGRSDTVRITGDTIFNNALYFIEEYDELFGNYTRYLRDSSGYLVNHAGRIYFGVENTLDTLHKSYDTSGALFSFWTMQQGLADVSLPVGTFQTKVVQGFYPLEFTFHPGNPRSTDFHYARDVGNVLHSAFYLHDDAVLEARLVEYHVE